MANQEQLAILQQGVEVWNNWRRENPYLAIDLQETDLRGKDLHGINLCSANLQGVNFQGANLVMALFWGANLQGANFVGANLQRADLQGADLTLANLQGVDIRGRNLREVSLRKANLRGANFQEANLQEADLREADLREAHFERAYLEWARFEGAIFEGAHFDGAGLFGSDFEEANLNAKDVEGDNAVAVMADDIPESLPWEYEKQQRTLRDKFKISIAYPKLLSKRFSSIFLVQIYLPGVRQHVLKKIRNQFKSQETEERIENSKLETKQEVRLHFSSTDIIFSEDVSKKLDHEINTTNFMAKPNDNCEPGDHQVILSISDRETGIEFESITFTVTVKDFAFDHVSRPLLSKVSSVALGVGSLAMFILTLMGQIDTTFGLTSGTVAGAMASAIVFQFSRLYQQPGAVHTP